MRSSLWVFRASANMTDITGKVVLPERITEIPEGAFSEHRNYRR